MIDDSMTSVSKPPAGHFNILYFAAVGSYTAKDHEALPAPLSLSKLFGALEERYSGIREKLLASCLVTVNLEYVDISDEAGTDDRVIVEGDEVAIIPPVSSG